MSRPVPVCLGLLRMRRENPHETVPLVVEIGCVFSVSIAALLVCRLQYSRFDLKSG